jgi:hypothetical protein
MNDQANRRMAASAMLVSFVLLAAGPTPTGAETSPGVWQIELIPTWGICGRGRVFARGTVDVGHMDSVSGMLTLYDGGRASFVTRLDRRHQFSISFLAEDGEGFTIAGAFSDSPERGTWESGTLSCGGNWQAERKQE